MLTRRRLQAHSPIKKLFHKLESSIQTYINYHKTHAMATCYSGMGDTSMENPKSQDVDSDSQENYQEENISLQHLTHKMEQLRQTVEDKDNDPRDAIHQLEQKLKQLTITLCPPSEPIEEVLDKYTDTCVHHSKENIFRKFSVARYSYFKWTRFLTIRGLAH